MGAGHPNALDVRLLPADHGHTEVPVQRSRRWLRPLISAGDGLIEGTVLNEALTPVAESGGFRRADPARGDRRIPRPPGRRALP